MSFLGKLLGIGRRVVDDETSTGSGSSAMTLTHTPVNESSVAFSYISARFHGRKLPPISHLRKQLREWLMSLEIDENAAVYETVKKRSIPLRKIISGDYRVDGSRGDGTPPWAVRRAAPTRIRHAGRVYVLDDGMDRVARGVSETLCI